MVLAVLAGGSGCDAIRVRQDLDKANKLFAAKKYDQAIPVYERVIKSDPDNWMANYNLALAWMAQFHPASTHPMDAEIKTKALAGLEKLMSMQAPDAETKAKVENYYLSLLTSAGDNEQAIAFLEKKIQMAPSDKDLMSQLATLQAKAGNFDESLKWYEKIANQDPNTKTNWYTVAVLCWEKSNKDGMTISPDERAGIIQRGIDSIDKALAIDPEYTEAIAYKNLLFREKADALSKAGKDKEAQEAFAESIRLRDQAMQLMQKKKAEAQAAPAPS
ncbi:MAG TPA: tetratricopeptide repeat protein [Candidatus Polarisedimenticolaceae bacterium]|nr:tetratricopeptide repeat protein [Candidatus Polarisedimenticolaceae bacterium]